MSLSWLESLVYGLISGLSEFFPISAEAHRILYLHLIGAQEEPALRLAVHIGAFFALLVSCAPILSRQRRELRIASAPKGRRKRQPDRKTLLDVRLQRFAVIPVLLMLCLYPLTLQLGQRLWVLGLLLALNGLLLYLPQYRMRANKDSLTLSPLDGVLTGLGCGLGILPGVSRMSSAMFVASGRGTERRYGLDFVLVVCLAGLGGLLIFDVWYLIAGFAPLEFMDILSCITAALAAFGAAYFAIFAMGFLAVKAGYFGFSYYSWGLALFALILYLMIS